MGTAIFRRKPFSWLNELLRLSETDPASASCLLGTKLLQFAPQVRP